VVDRYAAFHAEFLLLFDRDVSDVDLWVAPRDVHRAIVQLQISEQFFRRSGAFQKRKMLDARVDDAQ
jgi:hypothetical protein